MTDLFEIETTSDSDEGPNYTTREEWLVAAIDFFRPLFKANTEAELPANILVSVGFAKKARPNAIGWCYNSKASEGEGVNHVFVSPELNDPKQVVATLVHELCHAADNCESGHAGNFRVLARAMGLEGKLTSTHAGEDLSEHINVLIEELGAYPHNGLKGSGPSGGGTKQTTRMLKVVCFDNPEYKVRTTKKMLEEYGYPSCPCHAETMVLA